ncbi:RagB/SusD family nutrient uptake outer membrane protein [Parabacteroides sp. Marseille-P3160]|uniref:RagB/SusD family nutrient uptake outer membrane protein n=1 Tax=Parabacteroides sp. Marseille-P3160 TaxID=1917887 RepID=UPI0009BA0D16|nr:RagB/SusD family nutrient uptake outer membrane protein [Parabacteroides sp. Marseille-P3160]
MKKIKMLLSGFLLVALCTGCDSLLEPEDDNHSTFNRVYEDPSFAEGLLIRAYTYIPTNDYRFDEPATDDAVTNDLVNSYLRIATGEWTAMYNPQNLWDNCNRGILYINQFLEIVDSIKWKPTDREINDLFVRRLTGESYAMRGLLKYYLLRNHAGYDKAGNLLGTPIYNEFVDSKEGFATPRASFAESLQSTYEDLDKALTYLPDDYGNVSSIPAAFSEVKEVYSYNYVLGDNVQQRMSGRHAKAFKARLALLAASPAFNPNNDKTLWEKAANLTAELLDGIGGVNGLDPNGNQFYLKAQIDAGNLTANDKKDQPEILWRRPITTGRTRETNNFPPSLYGNGRINPTQNLVDAFPMKNGYPIDDPNSDYNAADPYKNRDPRLALYIVYDGSKLKNTTINTRLGSGSDGLNALVNSTRTGYYLKKLLREDVNVNPASVSDQQHFETHIRYTELFLNYAEAANEAWGPSAAPVHSYTAKNVIAAIRKRAGITQPDVYLESINTQEEMRTLIRNERRLELCFESFRFWDLRRWKADLTQPARGVEIGNNAYRYFTVEERAYDNGYMHYGPIPYNEVLKYDLQQNAGW